MIEINLREIPREFKLGSFTLKDLGSVTLTSESPTVNEFITLKTAEGNNCDFAATSWGFYLGPSLNSRLKKEGFKTALVINNNHQLYVMAVVLQKEEEFRQYLLANDCKVITWLDQWFENSVATSTWAKEDKYE